MIHGDGGQLNAISIGKKHAFLWRSRSHRACVGLPEATNGIAVAKRRRSFSATVWTVWSTLLGAQISSKSSENGGLGKKSQLLLSGKDERRLTQGTGWFDGCDPVCTFTEVTGEWAGIVRYSLSVWFETAVKGLPWFTTIPFFSLALSFTTTW